MVVLAFLGAVLGLLLAPGPTNTLMALAGAKHGLYRAMRLIPADVLGYMTTILPLAYLGADTIARWPMVSSFLTVAAATWVMFLAVRLWGMPDQNRDEHEVTARRVYLTTMLNPKALVFGLILLPAPEAPDFPEMLGLFVCMVAAVAVAWSSAGWLARYGEARSERLYIIQRMASVWLALVSGTLIVGVLRR